MTEKKEYPNVVITGVWETKNGHLNSMPLDQRALDTLREVMETGGKILIRRRSEKSIAESKNPGRTPPYYLEFVPKVEVDKFEAQRPRGSSQGL